MPTFGELLRMSQNPRSINWLGQQPAGRNINWLPSELQQPLGSAQIDWVSGKPRINWLGGDDDNLRPQVVSDEIRSPLWRVVEDTLNIGLYPVANVANAILKGDTNLAQAFWRGLTLQERNTFTDILKSYKVPAAPIIGFVLDNALDINTYLNYGIPILSKVLKATKGAGWVDDALRVIKDNSVIHKIGEIIEPAKEALGKAFIYGYKLPKEYVESKLFRRYALTTTQRALLDEIDDYTVSLKKALGENYNAGIWKQMSRVKEGLEPMTSLPEAAQKILVDIGNKLEDFAKRGVELGLFDESILDDAIELYLPHMYSARIKKYGFRFEGPLKRPEFTRPRSFKNLDEVREFTQAISKVQGFDNLDDIYKYLDIIDDNAIKAGKEIRFKLSDQARAVADQKGLQGVKDWAKEVVRFNTPIEDIRVLYGIYANEFVQYEAKRQWLNEVFEKFGTRVSADMSITSPDLGLFLPRGKLRFFSQDVLKAKGFSEAELRLYGALFNKLAESSDEVIELPSDLLSTIVGVSKNVEAWLLPKEIAKDLNKTVHVFNGDEVVDSLRRFLDKGTGVWKTWATAWRLPFHLRNLYSNWYMLWLADVDLKNMPSLAKQALDIMTGKNPEMLETMKKVGVIRTGFFGETFNEMALKIDELYKGKLTSKIEELFRLPQKFGAAIEDHSRAMLFLDGVQKGLSEREAAKRVFKYLFNYDEITPFERTIKQYVPFYTWMRKNIALQLHTLVTNPRKIAKTLRGMDALESMADVSHDEYERLPEWMKRFGYFKLPFKDKDGEDLWAYIDLPTKALETLTTNPLELLGSLTPLASLALTAMNVKPYPLFREGGIGATQIEKFAGEMEKAPFFVGWLPEPVMRSFGIQPIVDRKSGKSVLGWPKKMAQVFYTIFPHVRELANLVPEGGVDIERGDAPWRLASYATGVRITPINRTEQDTYWAFKQQKKLELVVQRMRQLGRHLTPEELNKILER